MIRTPEIFYLFIYSPPSSLGSEIRGPNPIHKKKKKRGNDNVDSKNVDYDNVD